MAQFGQQNVLRDAPGIGINNLDYATDFWLEDGSFARLENLTLGYNVKDLGNASRFIRTLRFSFTGNNLFVITKYKGIDPELSQSGGNGFGIDYGIYPRIRSFALGVNLILN
jgi:hypothetical protein